MPIPLLIQAESRAVPLADKSVHCIVTSPPYFALRDYGTGVWQGGELGCAHAVRTVATRAKQLASSGLEGGKGTVGHNQEGYKTTCPRCGATRIDQQLGLEKLHDCAGWATGQDCGACYICHMRAVARECWRVLRDDGVMFINLGDSYQDKQLMGIPWRLALALQADGWILRSEIIWHKNNPMPESVTDRPTRSHEQVFLFSKGERYFYDGEAIKEHVGEPTRRNAEFRGVSVYKDHIADKISNHAQRPPGQSIAGEPSLAGRNARSVWEIATEPFSGAHFATYPTALVRRCILAGTSEYGVCSACKAPWVREVDVTYVNPGHRTTNGPRSLANRYQSAGFPVRLEKNAVTTGWRPTCACGATLTRATVFDPFCGSGTTLAVACALGRDSLGTDLSYPYLHGIARLRLAESVAQPHLFYDAPRMTTPPGAEQIAFW
jgi:DNA modification methylase